MTSSTVSASSAGSGPLWQRWVDKSAQDTTRVSHSKGHTHSHHRGPDHHRTTGSLTDAPPRRTNKTRSHQADGITDLSFDDGIAHHCADGEEPTHNRPVAGSRPTSPTQRRRSHTCGDCFACSVVLPSDRGRRPIQPALQAGHALVRISENQLCQLCCWLLHSCHTVVLTERGCSSTTRIALATSSGRRYASSSGEPSTRPAPMANSVAVPAGQISVTRIPSARSSRSSEPPSPTWANLVPA